MNTSARILSALLAFTAIAVLLSGCGGERKLEPVPVGEMEDYRDPGIGFHMKYPKGWIANTIVGRARFYNAQDVDKKFLEPTGAYPLGVVVSIDVTKTGNVQEAVSQFRSELEQTGSQIGQEQSVKVGERDATKIPYTANFGGGNIVHGHHVLLTTDSALYDIGFAGFGDHYNAHAAVFEACLNSFEPPKPVVKGRDETLPSETFSDSENQFLGFQYPDNFNFSNPPKGKNDLVVGLRGVRLDCGIQFDVFGAKGLTVDKVFDQNKGKFRGATFGDATVGGQPAKFLTYSATKDVDRRIYFVVKNDKVIRMTFDWFKPQRADYLAAYDKVVASIKLK